MKQDVLNEKILPFAAKLQNNSWIQCISKSFMAIMPTLLVGAVFSLLKGLPLGNWYSNFLNNSGLSKVLGVGVDICNLTALYVVIALGYNLGKMFNKNAFDTAILSILSFMIISPLGTAVKDAAGTMIPVGGVFVSKWFGAFGIFSAIIISICASSMYNFIINRNWKIKLPESVPEFVAKPFEGVIPFFLVTIVFLIVNTIFAHTSFGNFHQFIYTIIQIPLTTLGNSLAAHVICIILVCLLWWIGVHGTALVLSVMSAIWLPATIENVNNMMAGLPVTNITSYMFFFVFVQFVGGPGMMFGLYVDMFLFAKSEQYKALGKVTFIPGMFNIIEPTVFGFPIVLNPIMFVPFVTLPALGMLLSYWLMKIGLIGIPVIQLAVMTMPGPIVGFLLGGGISLGIWLIVLCIISCIVYLPFFKVCDTQAYNRELKIAEEKKNMKVVPQKE